ncbi:sulfotransferase family protein [Pontiella sulfatireligans]|uniref:Sulfotransferase family protein n=1 Tax=Pontiella sulfatireligans TaxID=2750658 RepID=A0A6C2UL90_9BACT|nr:sulfotransferase family 2 domain-containing protein [Pontiella sulfatireligans]VGO21000.1 hypothetical protein SCARR_03069 [Pontiella sulfatireligans]
MIVSHKHKFIFIKTAKTAGTSFEIALSKYCGPDDIITPISPADEKIRGELGCRGPQNHLAPRSDYGLMDRLNLLFRKREKRLYYNHMPAFMVKELIGDDIWSSYYKFCFERNPWDKVLSLYYWKNKTEPRPPVSEYLESADIGILKKRGIRCYAIDGKAAMDRVCKFENLKDELKLLQERFELPGPIEMPFAKGSYRKDKRHYRDVLTAAEAERIGEIFKDEIELMGYEF